MKYLARFEENEGLKDVGRLGAVVVGVGSGGLLGAEAGSAIMQKNVEARLGYLEDGTELKKARRTLRDVKAGRMVQQGIDGKRSFDLGRVLAGTSKGKIAGVAAGALGGYIAGTTIGNKLFPNTRYEDDVLREQRADRRKEAGRINRTSEEIRGWSNLARRIGG